MLSKKFSTTLLALVVAAAIPGSAFAADLTSDTAGEASAPTSVSEPADSPNTSAAPENTTQPATSEGQQTSEVTDDTTPAEVTDDTTPVEVTEPSTPAEVTGPTAPAEVTEPTTPAEVKEPTTEPQVPATEPAAEPKPAEGATTPSEEPEPATDVQTPAEDVTTPAEPVVPAEEFIIPEIAPIEEIATEPAIVIEPVEATVTITHRLYYGNMGEYDDYVENVNGLHVGDKLDLAARMVGSEDIKCVSADEEIVLSEENQIILEYKLTEE